MSRSCSCCCRRVSSLFSSRSAVTHWGAAGNINQCAEQSAPSLIQSPLHQNAAIRTTEACESVCSRQCYGRVICCVCAGPPATDPKQTLLARRRGKKEQIEHYGDECCVKLELPLSRGAQVRPKIRREVRDISVAAVEAEIETKKWRETEENSVFHSR